MLAAAVVVQSLGEMGGGGEIIKLKHTMRNMHGLGSPNATY